MPPPTKCVCRPFPAVSTRRRDRAVPAHQLPSYRISQHGRRYRVLPERGVSSYAVFDLYYAAQVSDPKLVFVALYHGCPV